MSRQAIGSCFFRWLALLGLCICLTGCQESVYTLIEPKAEMIEVQTYRVEYVDENGSELTRAKVGSGALGGEVVERPPVIAGYRPKEQELRASLKRGETLVLRFYYTQTPQSAVESAAERRETDSVWQPLLFVGGLTLLLLLVVLQLQRRRPRK